METTTIPTKQRGKTTVTVNDELPENSQCVITEDIVVAGKNGTPATIEMRYYSGRWKDAVPVFVKRKEDAAIYQTKSAAVKIAESWQGKFNHDVKVIAY